MDFGPTNMFFVFLHDDRINSNEEISSIKPQEA